MTTEAGASSDSASTARTDGAGSGSGSGAFVRMTTGSGRIGAGASAVSGFLPPNCSVKYSAVILSSELDGTLAAAMPNSFALTSTSLLSMPSFFAMS